MTWGKKLGLRKKDKCVPEKAISDNYTTVY